MTERLHAGRLSIEWTVVSKGQLRSIDRNSALEILHCINRYLRERQGDVKKLRPPLVGYRLRCEDYRVLFDLSGEDMIQITTVKHRREAYRAG